MDRSQIPSLQSLPDDPELLHRYVADSIPQLVWTAAPDGAVSYFNRRVVEYSGLSGEDLAGWGWQRIVHPEDWPECERRWRHALATGEPYGAQIRLRRHDGAWRWHLDAALPLRDGAGRIVRWFGTCTDIHERVEQLRKSEDRFRSLVDMSMDFYWETDAGHRFTVLETSRVASPGFFAATRIGKTRWEVPCISPDADGWRAHRETLEARLPFRDLETARPTADGGVRHYTVSGEPVFGPDGAFRGYRGVGREITDRKRAELALRESSARYRALVNAIDGIVWEAEPGTFRFLFVSDKAERLLGYPVRQWTEEPEFWRNHVHPEDRDWAAEYCARTTAEMRDHEIEYRMIASDGRVVWLHDRTTVVVEDGRVARLRGIMVDVTARKEAEAALRGSEARFRALTRMSSDFFWETDAEHRFRKMEYGERFPGPMDSAFYIGKTRWEVPYESPDEAGWQAHRRLLAERRPIRDFTFSRRDRSGAERTYSVDGDPLFDAAGAFLGYRGLGRDVTERIAAERALRESEERFKLFMDNSPTLAWIKDSRLRYVYVNRAHVRAHGRVAQDMIGRDDFALWPEPLAREFRAGDEAALAAERPVSRVESVPHAGGRPGHWLVVKFRMPDGTGAPGVAGVAIDISERVEAERRALASTARSRKLMARLVETQEAERRRVATDLHDLVGQNLGALSAMLGVVRGEATRKLTSRLLTTLDDMERLLDETTRITREVMTDLRPAVLDDYGLVPALDWYAQEFATRSGLRVSVEGGIIEPRLPVQTELALFRIVQEALANAAKHSGAAKVRVAVEMGEGRVRLIVEDDGRGFAERADARRRQAGGYGLPAMRERAEAVKGTLRVESPGVGTRIVAEIPYDHPRRPD